MQKTMKTTIVNTTKYALDEDDITLIIKGYILMKHPTGATFDCSFRPIDHPIECAVIVSELQEIET